jgi:hypothetical protein
MADLDSELGGLRNALRESVRAPEPATVIRRHEQRIARRRRQLGAAAAVLLIGASIPLLRMQLAPAPDPAANPPGTAAGESSQTVDAGKIITAIDLFDDRHGFAVRASCTVPVGDTKCTSELLVMSDGEHWQTRGLPDELASTNGWVPSQLVVLGPDRLSVGYTFPPAARGSFFSADAGRTWTKVPAADGSAVPAIPDGGALQTSCIPPDGCHPELIATDPGSGRMANLATAPPLTDPVPASGWPVGGGWWAYGKDPATGRWALAVSRDAGRGWSVGVLPGLADNPSSISVTARGSVIYATAAGRHPNAGNALLGIFRSTDGGHSWEMTSPASGDWEPRTIAGIPVAAADGRLLVASQTGAVFASTDGGKTFALDRGAVFAGNVRWTRAGYLAATSAIDSGRYMLSADGVHWKEILIAK